MTFPFRSWLVRGAALAALTLAVPACADTDADDRPTNNTEEINATEAPYPIVLAHGFFGFKTFAGVDFITYYFGVEADLRARGEARVFTPAVDPFNDSTVRGKQLEAHILEILKKTGAKKVNIIAHSQGGLDARVVAHDRPDLVASITTVATPHGGSKIADAALAGANLPFVGGLTGSLIDSLVRLLGAPLWDELGRDTSVTRALRQVSPDGMRAFNARYPNAPGVRYFSLAGRTAQDRGGSACRPDVNVDFVARASGETDGTDVLLKIPELVVSGFPFRSETNDGFVRASEARWGTFLGCVPADHLDEIGHLLGDQPGGGNAWDHRQFYRDIVGFLRGQGL